MGCTELGVWVPDSETAPDAGGLDLNYLEPGPIWMEYRAAATAPKTMIAIMEMRPNLHLCRRPELETILMIGVSAGQITEMLEDLVSDRNIRGVGIERIDHAPANILVAFETREFPEVPPACMKGMPVWIECDPSCGNGEAAVTVLAMPPTYILCGYSALESYRILSPTAAKVAGLIQRLIGRYQVAGIGINVAGVGAGVHELVRGFYPDATPRLYQAVPTLPFSIGYVIA